MPTHTPAWLLLCGSILLACGCDPGYSAARAAGAPVDETTYHQLYGWGDAARYSTSDVLAEIRKPCREERLPFFTREYLRRTPEPGVIEALPDLVLKAREPYVQDAFAEALATSDGNVPREHLEAWQTSLRAVLASPALTEECRPAFARALERTEKDPGHFRSLEEAAAKRAAKEEEARLKAAEKEAERQEKERRRQEKEQRRRLEEAGKRAAKEAERAADEASRENERSRAGIR